MSVIGHYSSEMTANALKIYATLNIPLLSPSAADNSLASTERTANLFYRLTSKNSRQATDLAKFIAEKELLPKLTVIYNQNSDYCCSFRESFLNEFNGKVVLEYGGLSANNFNLLEETIRASQNKGTNCTLLIPDGGIELRSLQIAGKIMRQTLDSGWLIGGATLLHQETLDWVREVRGNNSTPGWENIVISTPWHPSDNDNQIAQRFGQESEKIWGDTVKSWREGTAYDAAWMLAKAIHIFNCQDTGSQKSLTQILSNLFKQHNTFLGVTGNLEFHEWGDRMNSSVQLVQVVRVLNSATNKIEYQFSPL